MYRYKVMGVIDNEFPSNVSFLLDLLKFYGIKFTIKNSVLYFYRDNYAISPRDISFILTFNNGYIKDIVRRLIWK